VRGENGDNSSHDFILSCGTHSRQVWAADLGSQHFAESFVPLARDLLIIPRS
jgi:hypothetical protein